jgi:trk system potassium uptake protein TrkH
MGLFQLGGLGIMTFSTLVLLVAGRSISIKDRIIIQKGFHHSAAPDIKKLIRNIFLFTLSIEAVGALLLWLSWRGRLPSGRAAFHAVFHSVSAFCNAGFSTFSNNIESFRGDIRVNGIIMGLIIFGGLGFLVLNEIRQVSIQAVRHKKIVMSLHAKMVLSVTVSLIVVPLLFYLWISWDRSLQGLPFGEKVLASLFQVVTARTAGFNTLGMAVLSAPTVFLLIFLMFIGASPGSTGGGIKTSTFGVIFAFLRSKIRARESTHIFQRTLPVELIIKAFTLVTLSFSVIFIASFLLLIFQPGLSMKVVFFEVFSAFGTVGLSLGLTPELGTAGKIVVILTMYIGRIGPLTILLAFSRRRAFGKYSYVEESVMIG